MWSATEYFLDRMTPLMVLSHCYDARSASLARGWKDMAQQEVEAPRCAHLQGFKMMPNSSITYFVGNVNRSARIFLLSGGEEAWGGVLRRGVEDMGGMGEMGGMGAMGRGDGNLLV